MTGLPPAEPGIRRIPDLDAEVARLAETRAAPGHPASLVFYVAGLTGDVVDRIARAAREFGAPPPAFDVDRGRVEVQTADRVAWEAANALHAWLRRWPAGASP